MGAPNLDINFIKPFFMGALETLTVQCGLEAKVGRPTKRTKETKLPVDIAAIIGLTSSTFNGSISINFPKDTFLKVMGGMLGMEFTEIDDDLEDGAGELLNIIFGCAKRDLNEKGYNIEKAIPTVVRGQNIKLQVMSETPAVIVPIESSAGRLFIEIALD